jgi:hypothetical protein
MELNPYAHDVEEQRKQIQCLDQMSADLFTIQCDRKDSPKFDKAFQARLAIADLKHQIMLDLGLR